MNPLTLFRSFLYAALAALVVILALGYYQGYRPSRSGVAFPGHLIATIPLASSTVYLDESKIGITSTSSEEMRFDSLAAGKHTLLVGREGYWPWQKTLRIKSRATVEVHPFHVPKDTSGVIISNKDPEYWKLLTQIRNEPLPTPEARRISTDKSVAIWTEGQDVYASFLLGKNRTPSYFCPNDVCVDVLSVYKAKDSVRSLDFYPGRPDVLLLATTNAVYAIEVDATGMQNFQPIYKGNLPSFILSDHQTLLIEDAGNLYEIAL